MPSAAAGFGHAADRLLELVVDVEALRVAEVQAVRDGDRRRAGADDVARRLGDGDGAAGVGVEVDRAAVAVRRDRDGARAVPLMRRTAASEPGVDDRVGQDLVVVLAVDPALAGDVRARRAASAAPRSQRPGPGQSTMSGSEVEVVGLQLVEAGGLDARRGGTAAVRSRSSDGHAARPRGRRRGCARMPSSVTWPMTSAWISQRRKSASDVRLVLRLATTSMRSCDSLSMTSYGVMPSSRRGTCATSISMPASPRWRALDERAGQAGGAEVLQADDPVARASRPARRRPPSAASRGTGCRPARPAAAPRSAASKSVREARPLAPWMPSRPVSAPTRMIGLPTPSALRARRACPLRAMPTHIALTSGLPS